MIIENEYPIKTISGKENSIPEKVYLVRNGTQISRIYTPPVLPPSDERKYVLALTQILRSTWWDLTNKELWDDAARRVSNLWDEKTTAPLGMNLFLSTNFYRFLHSQQIDLEPPTDTSIPLVTITQVHLRYDPILAHTRLELKIYFDSPGPIYLYPRIAPSSGRPDKKWRLWEYKSIQKIGTAPSVYGPFTPSIYTLDAAPSGQILTPGQWSRLQIKPLSSSFILGSALTYGPLLVESY